ncbi:MAG: type II secretion system F family protein [Mycobacteriales bacterium]
MTAAALAGLAGFLVATARPEARLRLAGLAGGRSSRRPIPRPLAGAVAGAVLLGPVGVPLGGLAVVVVGRVLARRARAAAEAAERARVLEALAVLGGDLRTGRVPADALSAAAAVAVGGAARALAAAAAAARLGGDVPSALTASPSAVPEVLRGLAACWSVCTSAGSGLAAGVDRLTEGLRSAEEQRRAVAAELAGPRATAGLLAVLPAGGIGLAAALGASPLHVLLHTPAGFVCLLLGLLLDGAGLLWTARLVARAGG